MFDRLSWDGRNPRKSIRLHSASEINGGPGQEAFHPPPRSQDLTENRMRLEPVALFTEALALLPYPAFALLGSAHLIASQRQLIPHVG